MKSLLRNKPSTLKRCLSVCIPLLFLTIANPATAAGESSSSVSATNCLSSLVSVRDSNGNSVMIDPALLQQNRLFKGGLVAGLEPGTVEYSPDNTSLMDSCYGQTPPLIAEDKTVTTVMNRSININALLAQPKEHGPRGEQGERQLLDILMAAKNGKAKINGSGIRYKPNKDWCGIDNFSYQVTDGIDVVEETTTVNVQCEATAEPNETLTSEARYVAKVFDVDNDGLHDVYIFTNSGTRVKDFYLKQTFNSKFILRVATISDSIGAIHQPDTEIIVTRADYNADGLYDFLISSIDEYIWGAQEQIIITKKGNSTQVGKLIAIDDHFRDVRDGIEAINDPALTDFMVGLYNNQINYCTEIWIPFYVWSWSQERYVTYWVLYRTCTPGRSFLSSNVRHPEYFDYTKSLSAMDARYGLNGFAAVGDNSWYNTVFNKVQGQLDSRQLIKTARIVRSGAQIWRAGSVAATIILIADDATIVGVIDDVALPATLISVGVSYIFIEALDYYIIQMEANPGSDDVGIEDRENLGAGSFAIPGNCAPKTPGQEEAGEKKGRSDRLNRNMVKSNCWCVNPDTTAAAHHIIPKVQGEEVGDALRSCFKNKRKIDIDSAINGVCLPKGESKDSSAFPHRGSEGNLHGKERLKVLLQLCEDGNLSDEQFIDKIREIAEGYSKGIMLP